MHVLLVTIVATPQNHTYESAHPGCAVGQPTGRLIVRTSDTSRLGRKDHSTTLRTMRGRLRRRCASYGGLTRVSLIFKSCGI